MVLHSTRRYVYLFAAAVMLIAGFGAYIEFGSPPSLVATSKESDTAAANITFAQSDTSTATSAAPTAEKITPQMSGPKPLLVVQPSGIRVTGDIISHSAPPPLGYVEYRNDEYGFSFFHLPTGKVSEYDEGDGAKTIVLENVQKARGMQIYVLPYNEPTISEERFHKDVPSGVRNNVEDTTLDGVRAVTFNSVDGTLGETREIWVIHNGYLYEITTFSGVGQWFTPIIQSWHFI